MCDFIFLTVCECFFCCCPKGMASVCVWIWIFVYVCVYAFICTYMCLCIYLCVYIYVCMCLSIMCICVLGFVCICVRIPLWTSIPFLQGSTLAPHHPQTGIKSRVVSLYSALSLGASFRGTPGSRVWVCSVQMLSSSPVLIWLCFCLPPVVTL